MVESNYEKARRLSGGSSTPKSERVTATNGHEYYYDVEDGLALPLTADHAPDCRACKQEGPQKPW